MTATIVNGKLLSPAAGSPAASQLTITLVDYNDTPIVGFNTVDDTEILATDTIIPTPSGLWTVQLVPNADIQLTDGTAQSAYRIVESGDGSTFTYWIIVAASVNPVWAGSIRTTLVGSSGGSTPNGYAIQGALNVGGDTTLSGGLTIPSGAAAGKVWTATDTGGDGSWQTPSGGGAGTVVSVNDVTPDGAGNITLTAGNVGADTAGAAAAAQGAATAAAETDAAAKYLPLSSASSFDAAGAAAAAQSAAIAAAETNAAATYIPLTAGGANSGVATLDSSGHLTPAQAANLVTKTSPVNLTDGPTIATDASQSNLFRVTLGGNRTLSNPTNAVDGQLITWSLKQDATGGRTITLDTKFRFGTDITSITLTTTAGKTDHLGARYNAGDDKFDVIAFVRGF